MSPQALQFALDMIFTAAVLIPLCIIFLHMVLPE